MDIDPGALPDNIDALKDIVRAALAQRDNARADAAAAQAERSDVAAYIAHLKLQIEKLKRTIYGPRAKRTARLLDQMEFELEELEATATEDELRADVTLPTTTRKVRVYTFAAIKHENIFGRNSRYCRKVDNINMLKPGLNVLRGTEFARDLAATLHTRFSYFRQHRKSSSQVDGNISPLIAIISL